MSGLFGATSTTDEVLASVDLKGKRVLVTGVSVSLRRGNRARAGSPWSAGGGYGT